MIRKQLQQSLSSAAMTLAIVSASLLPIGTSQSSSDARSCGETQWRSVGIGERKVTVWRVLNPSGFLYVTGMAVDADGSPRAYNPNNTGLDDNQNAKNGDQWVGVVTEH